MPIVKKNLLVPYTPTEMFALVDAVNRYPEFLPWCAAAQEISRTEDEVRASLTLRFGGLEKSFQTCNRRQPPKMLEMRLVEGPFAQLEGFWLFHELADHMGTQIAFHLAFEFSQSWMAHLFGTVFQKATEELVDAFYRRAQALYGHRV